MSRFELHCVHVSMADVADICQVVFETAERGQKNPTRASAGDYLMLQRAFEMEEIEEEITGRRIVDRCRIESGNMELYGDHQIRSARLTRDRFVFSFGDPVCDVSVTFEADDATFHELRRFLKMMISKLELASESAANQ